MWGIYRTQRAISTDSSESSRHRSNSDPTQDRPSRRRSPSRSETLNPIGFRNPSPGLEYRQLTPQRTSTPIDRGSSFERDFWLDDDPLEGFGLDTLYIEEGPLQDDNMDPNYGNARGAAGGPPGEGPPPYPGHARQDQPIPNMMDMIQGLIQAQHNQHQQQLEAHQAQMETNQRLQEAHQNLGAELRNLAIIVGNMSHNPIRPQPGAEHRTFKPGMFRPLDMKQVSTKDNKLLSEEFINWKTNIYRVLQANPAAAALPMERLTALILAGIGEKAERRLAGLGQNPTFNSLEEFFERLKAIFCSSTERTDAEAQFNKAKQYQYEDINGWHARCLLYYQLAFPTQDYWNLALKKFFQGMSDRKIAEKCLDHIHNQDGGWEALTTKDGYDQCLKITLKKMAFQGFKMHLLEDKSRTSYEPKTETAVPMDTSSIQNGTRRKNYQGRQTTAHVRNEHKPDHTTTRNPPAGSQKKLQEAARKTRTTEKDRSKDKCLKCGQVGHWARNCTNGQVSTIQESHDPSTPAIPETRSWADVVATIPTPTKKEWPTVPIPNRHPKQKN